MTSDNTRPPTEAELTAIIIARELNRRPELQHLAKVLQLIVGTEPVVGEVSPIYVSLAKQLIDDKAKRENFLVALRVCVKD